MRIVFMGTPEFAVPSLRALHQAHEVVAVYTRPDAASGRGRSAVASPVAVVASELGIALLKPDSMRGSDAAALLAEQSPDVVVVAAFGMILPEDVLMVPRLGCVNVHASILPRWRGAAPIQRAILAGDVETGVSIMLMEEGLDTGPYCAVAATQVDDKTTQGLTDELARMGAALLVPSLSRMESGTCEWMAQDDALATYAPKILKSDVALTPELTVEEFLRRVRASSGSAPARALVGGRGMTVTAATTGSGTEVAAGTVGIVAGNAYFGVKDGAVRVSHVKPDGKGLMEGSAWACGLRDDAITWGAVR